MDSLQLTVNKKVATPADWKVWLHPIKPHSRGLSLQSGGECMVLPNVSEEDAKQLFPLHRKVDVPSGKSYIRVTPQP